MLQDMSDNKKFTPDKETLEGQLDKLKCVIYGDSKQDIYTESQVYWRKDTWKFCRANAMRITAILHT